MDNDGDQGIDLYWSDLIPAWLVWTLITGGILVLACGYLTYCFIKWYDSE